MTTFVLIRFALWVTTFDLFRFRFREECSLQNNATFKRVCAEHYRGEHDVMSKWERSSTRITGSQRAGRRRQRRANTTFSMLGIPIGTELVFTKDNSIICSVIDHKNRVKYDGKQWNLSTLAVHLQGSTVSGFFYFSYQGETLRDRRLRLEQGGADV